ncbi:MAG: hypothetical protein HYZ49_08480 [Chloroflexi bacterium]|nr:hypothetical protein [Chloroflexota bacterium]
MRPIKLLFWFTPPVLAIALYGSTLTLPFFWDDVANFQFLFDRPLAQIWVESSGFPYYRPLTFVLWRLIQITFGPLNPAPYHALNILALIACGWVVGLLANRLARNPSELPQETAPADEFLTGWLAGALMTVFPFAALVVPLVASFFHLFVTLVVAGACVCLLEFERTRKMGWAMAAIALAALAPFAHESGITAAALMAICFAARHLKGNLQSLIARRQSLAILALSFLFNLAFIPWWARIPKAQNGGDVGAGWIGWESVGQAIVFFFESLTFPIQFLARPLMKLGLVDMLAVLGLGLAALGLAAAILKERRWLVFGLAYCFAAAAPAIAALPFSYIIVSPRLMMVTAPAAAILWATVIADGTRRLARPGIRIGVAATVVAAISFVPALHISREVRLHHLTLDHLYAFVADLQAHPDDQHLIVNAVNWTAPVNATYALGHEGVEVMPAYLTPQLMAWVHTQTLYNVDAITFPLVFPQLNDIYFSTWGESEALDWNVMAERVRVADRVAVVQYADDNIQYLEVGNVGPASGEAVVSFEDRIWLTAIEVTLKGQVIELRLSWRVNAVSGEDIFANALDCAGNVAGLSGGASLGGIYPVWLWQPGESIHEIRRIPLTAPASDGCYRIELGLFNPQTGAAFDSNGARLENDIVVINLPAP